MVGSQRLEAYKELIEEGLIEDPNIWCLVHCKKGQINVPIGDVVPRNKRAIENTYFKGRTKKFVLDINNILLVPSENDKWDPDFQFSIHDNPEIIRNFKIKY